MEQQKARSDPPAPGPQHNDWGHADGNQQSGDAAGTGGVGHRHRDWGHSDVGNAQGEPAREPVDKASR